MLLVDETLFTNTVLECQTGNRQPEDVAVVSAGLQGHFFWLFVCVT